MAPWLTVPLVAVVVIAGCAAISRLERAGKRKSLVTGAAVAVFLVLLVLLFLNQDSVLQWTLGILVGMGIGSSLFFHRNAGRAPQGGSTARPIEQ